MLHPQTDRYIPVDFGRKLALKRTLPEEEEANPRDKQWKRQREAGFTRQRMWAGTPIPAPTKKRKGISATEPDRCADSDGSSTEEWPSPTSSDSETHSATTHRAPLTSQPLPRRPRSAQAQVHVTNPTKKRKRRREVSIQKPQRPHKQHQSQPSHTAQQEPQVPFQRRSIEDIITHIHETRSHLLAQRSNPTSRNPHDKVSRRGIRRVRSGPRELGGTSDDDTEDPRPRNTTTSHTQSHTPSEPQRAALTPPPLDHEVGG